MVGRPALLLPVVLLISLLSAQVSYAAVSASLSEQVIDELETVRLTIRASQTRQTETLDLSALETDFHVMGTNTSSQYTFRNGRERSWVDYQITLQPKRTGDLTIPSIQVGQDHTPTITLTVRPLTDETRELIDQLVFFEQELSSESVYVQAQLLITRRLLYSNGVQLYSDLPGAPEIENAVVMTLGDPVSSTTQRDGRSYGVVEQHYAIFPELSGTLTIPSINLTASVRLINNGRVTRKGVRVGTETANITVKPVPATYPTNHPWIPAEEVSLHQVLTPDITDYKVGETIDHELLVYIKGNLGSIAPPQPLLLDSNIFRVYPTSPVIDDDAQRLGVVGSRRQSAAVIPLRDGRHRLPSLELYWWDTVSDSLQVASLPTQSLTITGTPVAIAGDENLTSEATQPASVETAPADDIEASDLTPTLPFDRDWFLWLATGMALLLALWGLWRLLHQLNWPGAARRARRRQLQSALRNLSHTDAKVALQQLDDVWAIQSGLPAVTARQQFVQQHPQAQDYLATLNQAAYTTTTADVSSAVTNLIKLIRSAEDKRAEQRPDLPALYPHQHSA